MAKCIFSLQSLAAAAAAVGIAQTSVVNPQDLFWEINISVGIVVYLLLLRRWALDRRPVTIVLIEGAIWLVSRSAMTYLFGGAGLFSSNAIGGELQIGRATTAVLACMPVALCEPMLRRTMRWIAIAKSDDSERMSVHRVTDQPILSPPGLPLILYRRGAQLRATSWGVLGLIVAILSGGIWLFLRAEQFSRLEEVGREIRNVKATMADVNAVHAKLENFKVAMEGRGGAIVAVLNSMAAVGGSTGDPASFPTVKHGEAWKELDTFKGVLTRLRDTYKAEPNAEIVAEIDSVISAIEKRLRVEMANYEFVTDAYFSNKEIVDNLKKITNSLDSLSDPREFLDRVQELADSPALKSDSVYFLATIISARIGIVLLLVFLVQLLASLYRYVLRLSVFYETRADILSVDAAPGNLADLLTPSQVDFGTAPKPLSDHLAKVVVELARAVQDKGSGNKREKE